MCLVCSVLCQKKKNKRDTGLTRFSLSGNFFPRIFTVFLCDCWLLLQFISTNKIHLADFVLHGFFLLFEIFFGFCCSRLWFQLHSANATAAANFHTLNSIKLHYYLEIRIRTRMNRRHSVYHLTMLTNLVFVPKIGIVLHVRLTSSKQ